MGITIKHILERTAPEAPESRDKDNDELTNKNINSGMNFTLFLVR